MPTLDDLLAGSGGGRKPVGPPTLDSLLGGGKKAAETPEEEAARLEAALVAAGQPLSGPFSFLPTARSAGSAVVDVLSRGNYAVAGAVDEFVNKPSLTPATNILKRVGRELFSGIGGLKGDKETFSQVLEQAGVGKGPSIRLNLSPLEGDSELSLRGTVGLLLDVATDPLTYVGGAGVGRRVITSGGRAVASKAGTEFFGREVAKHLAAGLTKEEAVPLAQKALVSAVEAGGENLVKRPGIYFAGKKIAPPLTAALPEPFLSKARKVAAGFSPRGQAGLIEGWAEAVTVYQKGERALVGSLNDRIAGARKNFKLDQAAMKRVAVALDEGKIGTLTGRERAAADWLATQFDEIAKADVAAGILKPSQVRQHYLPHFYENDVEEWTQQLNRDMGVVEESWDNIGRHKEERAFNTFADAEAWSKERHAIDPNAYPLLRPLYDPFEALRKRGTASLEARNFKEFLGIARKKFGEPALDPADLFAIGTSSQSLGVSQTLRAAIDKRAAEHAASGRFADKWVAKLSPNARRFYFEQRIANTTERAGLLDFVQRYGQTYHADFPKMKGPLVPLDDLGKPFGKVTIRGEEYTLPQATIKDIQGMNSRLLRGDKNGPLFQVLHAYDSFTNAFKLGVTALHPAFSFRNAYNNIFLSFNDIGLAAIDPRRHGEAFRILTGQAGEMVTPTGRYTYDELRKMYDALGIRSSAANMLELARGGASTRSRFDKFLDVTGKYPRKAASGIENEARALLFNTHLRHGLDPADAMTRVNKFLYDYSSDALTPFERDIMKRAVPFYGFLSKNTKRQIDNILHRPGRLATQIKPFRGRDVENQEMTSWEGQAFKVRLERDGRTLTTLTGIDLPVRQLDLFWRGDTSTSLLGAFGMTNPLVKVVGETMFGKSAFLGQELTRTKAPTIGPLMERAPQWARAMVGYRKDVDAAGRPTYSFNGERLNVLVQASVLSRFISTSDRAFREYLKDKQYARMTLDYLTGLRLKDLNLDEQQAKRAQERLRQLREAAAASGVGNTYQNIYLKRNEQGVSR